MYQVRYDYPNEFFTNYDENIVRVSIIAQIYGATTEDVLLKSATVSLMTNEDKITENVSVFKRLPERNSWGKTITLNIAETQFGLELEENITATLRFNIEFDEIGFGKTYAQECSNDLEVTIKRTAHLPLKEESQNVINWVDWMLPTTIGVFLTILVIIFIRIRRKKQ